MWMSRTESVKSTGCRHCLLVEYFSFNLFPDTLALLQPQFLPQNVRILPKTGTTVLRVATFFTGERAETEKGQTSLLKASQSLQSPVSPSKALPATPQFN